MGGFARGLGDGAIAVIGGAAGAGLAFGLTVAALARPLACAVVAVLAAAGVDRNHHHAPTPAAKNVAASSVNGSALRRRGAALNGVASVGASPRRRCASDFFRASSISDISEYQSRLRARCGPCASSADSANRVSGPTTPSARMP